MAGSYTRRTHMVRIKAPVNPFHPERKPAYVDIEVLDAIAFRTTNGEVMVMNVPTSKVRPYIVDNTENDPSANSGQGSGVNDNSHFEFGKQSTRRSHMKRIKQGANYFDIEILDNLAFNDTNGREWVLKMPSVDANPYNTTEGSSLRGGKGSRRTHLEVLKGRNGDGGGCGGCGGGSSYGQMVVERMDMMSFQTTNGKTMVVKCPSADDGSGSRANTYCTPLEYDANTGLPNPPINTDPNVYLAFVSKVVHFPPVFEGSLSGWGYTAHNTFDDTTFFSVPIYNSCEQAIEAGEASLGPEPVEGNLQRPIGCYFSPGGDPVEVEPAHDETISGGLDTGGLNGADTIKISMGPLWWVRRFSMDGEDGSV